MCTVTKGMARPQSKPSQGKAADTCTLQKFTADIFNLLACRHSQLNSESTRPAVLVAHWLSMLTCFQSSNQARWD